MQQKLADKTPEIDGEIWHIYDIEIVLNLAIGFSCLYRVGAFYGSYLDWFAWEMDQTCEHKNKHNSTR